MRENFHVKDQPATRPVIGHDSLPTFKLTHCIMNFKKILTLVDDNAIINDNADAKGCANSYFCNFKQVS